VTRLSGEAAIVGRDDELRRVQAFLVGIGHGAAALVLSGEPGIGKTALWDKGVEEASKSARVLAHRGVEAEAPLAFVGLSDLLAPIFDEVAPALRPPRRDALAVALLLVKPGDSPPDPRAFHFAGSGGQVSGREVFTSGSGGLEGLRGGGTFDAGPGGNSYAYAVRFAHACGRDDD
jgi:hypothetical protein